MTDTPNVRAEDSLAPLELDRLTVEEEAAFMNRGKGKQLLSAVVVVGALVAGGAYVMKEMDRQQAVLDRGEAVAALRGEHVEAYLRCVVKDATPTALQSNDRLHGLIEGVVERGEKRAAVGLERCSQKLAELGPALAKASVTSELAPALGGLRDAAKDLTSGATALSAYLADPDEPYDFVQVTALIDRVARAAAAYREHDDELRARLADL